MSTNVLLRALLWLVWAVTAAEFAAALNGFLIERREGLRISVLRFAIVAGIFPIATGLTVLATFMPETMAPAVITAAESKALDETGKAQLQTKKAEFDQVKADLDAIQKSADELEKRRTDLHRQEADLRVEIDQIGGGASVFVRLIGAFEQIDRSKEITLFLIIVVGLMILGFTILLMGGQIQTLLPESWSWGGRWAERKALQAEIDAVAKLVWDGKYLEALDKADTISDGKLATFDLLDLNFLRGFCCVQLTAFPTAGESTELRGSRVERALRLLESIVQQAPKHGAATYTLALAYGLAEKNAEALAMFERAEPLLSGEEVPLEYNQSVCLLKLAEVSLSTGNTEQADAQFARVAKLGKLSDTVVHARVRIGMIDLRGLLGKKDLTAAEAMLRRILQITGLSSDQRAQMDVISVALNAHIGLLQNDVERALGEVAKFINKNMPTGLPALDDELIDEPFSPILDGDLKYPRDLYCGLLFLQAVALCRLETKSQQPLSEAQVAKLAEPLMRALQFVPRQRELLAALGGLYYWFRVDKRDKAREWLEAAVTMGARSTMVRLILEHDRLVEMERRDALEWFRSASMRVLRDPAVTAEMRHALVEELGRFQEFEPMLINLKEKPEHEPEEPTIDVLRARATYLSELVAKVAGRGQSDRFTRLAQIQSQYTVCLSQLEQATQAIGSLERRVFSELADSLMLAG